jgi:hypothetical protein
VDERDVDYGGDQGNKLKPPTNYGWFPRELIVIEIKPLGAKKSEPEEGGRTKRRWDERRGATTT